MLNEVLIITRLILLKYLLIALPLFFTGNRVIALTYDIPVFGDLVGAEQTVEGQAGETLLELAQKFDIGAEAIANANPKLKPDAKLKKATEIIIPSEFKLPTSVPRDGVIVNLADRRIYYFHPSTKQVSTYPIGIGKEGWSTPLGNTKVIRKKKDPAWYPPASIRRAAERRGKTLPDVVPAGPNNPLGQYAIYLGIPRILIHGTNRPTSVGLRSSHGCIRMYAPNIEELFGLVDIGTPVSIIFEPNQND